MEHVVLLALRALHILSAVFWAGSISLLARYVVPAARSRSDIEGLFLAELFKNRKLGLALGGSGTVNVVTGSILYGQLYIGQPWNLRDPGPAEAFGIGGLLAIIALLLGAGYGIKMLFALRRERDGPPDAALARKRAGRVATLARINMFLLVPATILMGVARYL